MVPHSVNRKRPECLSKLLALALLLVIPLAVGAEEPPTPPAGVDLVILRSRWMRSPRDPVLSDQLAQQLFMEGRREEACRILLGAHAYAKTRADREMLASRVRVLSRSFLSADVAKSFQSGLNALSLGRLPAAGERLTQVLSLEPGHADALVRRGQVRWLLGNADGAFEDFSQAFGVNPFAPEIQAWVGVAQFRRGERAQGFIQMQAALRSVSPEQRRAHFWRVAQAVLQWESGHRGLALEKLYELARERPGAPWLWEYLLREGGEPRPAALARVLLRTRPERSVDLDGPSGLRLEYWDPELVRERLSAINPVDSR